LTVVASTTLFASGGPFRRFHQRHHWTTPSLVRALSDRKRLARKISGRSELDPQWGCHPALNGAAMSGILRPQTLPILTRDWSAINPRELQASFVIPESFAINACGSPKSPS
jgi:hypothetical protein